MGLNVRHRSVADLGSERREVCSRAGRYLQSSL